MMKIVNKIRGELYGKLGKVSQRCPEVNWEERIKYFLVLAPGFPLRNSSAVEVGER
jgi:hypothetical protein